MTEEKIDLLKLKLLRQGKEKSHALPADHYRDPSQSVKFASETKSPKGKQHEGH